MVPVGRAASARVEATTSRISGLSSRMTTLVIGEPYTNGLKNPQPIGSVVDGRASMSLTFLTARMKVLGLPRMQFRLFIVLMVTRATRGMGVDSPFAVAALQFEKNATS